MSKHDLKRRPSPLSGPGGRGIDPDVQKTIQHAQERWGSKSKRKQYNLTLPTWLADAVKQEGARLTGHQRRGFSDLVTILLEHGWKAYLDEQIEVELVPAGPQRIVTSKD
jgi:hypothetical protein